MTVLSDGEILTALREGMISIVPFSKKRLTSAGYDFASNSSIDLHIKDHKLILTFESIELNAETLATIHLKSSLAREGVLGSFAVIDPGFRGRLTLSMFNAGTSIVRIEKNEPIVNVVFQSTGTPSNNPYNGKYQDSYEIIQSRRGL